jgi:hypothetical protein
MFNLPHPGSKKGCSSGILMDGFDFIPHFCGKRAFLRMILGKPGNIFISRKVEN